MPGTFTLWMTGLKCLGSLANPACMAHSGSQGATGSTGRPGRKPAHLQVHSHLHVQKQSAAEAKSLCCVPANQLELEALVLQKLLVLGSG